MKATRTGLLAFIVVFSTILIVSLIFALNGRFAVEGGSSSASSFVSSSKSGSGSSSKSAILGTRSQIKYPSYPEEERERILLEAQKLKEDLIINQTYKINIDVLEKAFKRQITEQEWWNILDLIAQDSRYSFGFGNYGIDPSAPPNPYTPKDFMPNTYYNKYFYITYPAQSLSMRNDSRFSFGEYDLKLLRNFDPVFNQLDPAELFGMNNYMLGGHFIPEFRILIYGKIKSKSSNQIILEDILPASKLAEHSKQFQIFRTVTLNNQNFTYLVLDGQEYLCLVKNNIVFTLSFTWPHSIFTDADDNRSFYNTCEDRGMRIQNQQMIEMLNSIQFK